MECSPSATELAPPTTGTLRGQVMLISQHCSYYPEPGIRVSIVGTSYTGVTDSNGYWSISGVPPCYPVFKFEGDSILDHYYKLTSGFLGVDTFTVRMQTFFGPMHAHVDTLMFSDTVLQETFTYDSTWTDAQGNQQTVKVQSKRSFEKFQIRSRKPEYTKGAMLLSYSPNIDPANPSTYRAKHWVEMLPASISTGNLKYYGFVKGDTVYMTFQPIPYCQPGGDVLYRRYSHPDRQIFRLILQI